MNAYWYSFFFFEAIAIVCFVLMIVTAQPVE